MNRKLQEPVKFGNHAKNYILLTNNYILQKEPHTRRSRGRAIPDVPTG